jgi:putative restriction endonuclease
LLALLDMAEAGELTSRAFTRTPGLVLRFRSYGAICSERWPHRLDVKLPFFYLSSQEFWEPFTAEMQRAGSPETCAVCEFDPEFFALLPDPAFRLKARMLLVAKYFEPAERIALLESLGLESGPEIQRDSSRIMEEAANAAKRKGRCARFAVRVVSEYRFTCALTGYRCVTGEGSTIVDAAHIEPWSEKQNDDLSNGLALCKNAHWMFDEGLWSADNDLRVIVEPRRFTEQGPEFTRLSGMAGRHLQFDPAAKLRPNPEMFRRHRARFGFRMR